MQSSTEQIAQWWDRVPCNSRWGTSPVGTAMWSVQISQQKYKVESHILNFADFKRWAGKRVLEIGCGIGTDTLEFAKAGAIVDAVDISKESLAIAKKRMLLSGLYADFLHMDAEKGLPGVKGGYDLIYSFGVLHHTPRPEKVLKLAYQRLKDAGELRIMLYAKWSIKNLLGQQPEAQSGCPLAVRYIGIDARRLAEQAGFGVMSIKKRHIFPYRVEDYVEHRYVKRLAYRWMPAWVFSIFERLLGDHLLVTARKRLNANLRRPEGSGHSKHQETANDA